jgi:cytochrome c-type biogenesis protein CcmF
MADITIVSKDSMHYKAYPVIQVDPSFTSAVEIDDTVYAQNLYFKFAGVTDNRRIKLGIKESDKIIDFVTLKAYLFPYINLVWLGLIIMAVGLMMSMINRAKIKAPLAAVILIFIFASMFFMFFIAH